MKYNNQMELHRDILIPCECRRALIYYIIRVYKYCVISYILLHFPSHLIEYTFLLSFSSRAYSNDRLPENFLNALSYPPADSTRVFLASFFFPSIDFSRQSSLEYRHFRLETNAGLIAHFLHGRHSDLAPFAG